MRSIAAGFSVFGGRLLLILSLGFILAPTLHAQTAIPGQKFVVDIVAADAPTAQAYTWKLYNDGATAGVVWAGVTCVASQTSGTQTCSGLMPAYTPGAHAVTFTASNAAGESPKSAVLNFTLVAVPNTPSTPRIQ